MTPARFSALLVRRVAQATSDGEPTHAARQLPNGKWTSKLGRWEDIEHDLEGLTGEMYGSVQQILKRQIS